MKLPGFRWLISWCAGSVLVGCATRVEMVSPVATAEHPRVVELYVAGMIQPRTVYTANGTFAAREEFPPQASYDGRHDDRPVTQQRFTPTPARWAAFWRTVDRLDMAAWKPEYDQGDMPANPQGEHIYLTDGLAWTTRFATPGHVRTSRGDGAFPRAGRPASTTVSYSPASGNGVLALEEAFEELPKP